MTNDRASRATPSGPRVAPTGADLYRPMFLIRTFETRILELFSQGRLFGTTHTYIGQEADAAGILAHLDAATDIVVSNHRCHGHYLAFTGDADGLMAEMMGRVTGVCGGKGGSQHLHAGNFYTNGVLGGTVALAAGMALAEKTKQSGARVVVFLGDGAMGEGIVYETLNMASLWSVPILFVVENNLYAQTTPLKLQMAGDMTARPKAFGIETRHCRPDSAQDVYSLAADAFAFIQERVRPYCLILDTYRFSAHSKGDDYRPPEELAEWRARDPLAKLAGALDAGARAAIEAEVTAQVARAVERAEAAPFPAADRGTGRQP